MVATLPGGSNQTNGGMIVNTEHALKILNVMVWNQWRKDNPDIIPDLSGADLRWANLRGTNLDFSCFPLWCGSFDIQTDNRLLFQLAYHICRLSVNTPEFAEIKKFLTPYANKFHRAEKCGKIIDLPDRAHTGREPEGQTKPGGTIMIRKTGFILLGIPHQSRPWAEHFDNWEDVSDYGKDTERWIFEEFDLDSLVDLCGEAEDEDRDEYERKGFEIVREHGKVFQWTRGDDCKWYAPGKEPSLEEREMERLGYDLHSLDVIQSVEEAEKYLSEYKGHQWIEARSALRRAMRICEWIDEPKDDEEEE